MIAKSCVVNKYLKKIRLERNLSIQKLAAQSNISASYISRIESNQRKPTAKSLKKLAVALGIDYIDLLKKADLLDSEIENRKNFKEVLFMYEFNYDGKTLSSSIKHKILNLIEEEFQNMKA